MDIPWLYWQVRRLHTELGRKEGIITRGEGGGTFQKKTSPICITRSTHSTCIDRWFGSQGCPYSTNLSLKGSLCLQLWICFISLSLFCIVSYLSLRNAEAGGQLRALGQRQVLRAVEPPLQLLDLQRGVDGARLADLLALAVDAGDYLAMLDCSPRQAVNCKFQGGGTQIITCSENLRSSDWSRIEHGELDLRTILLSTGKGK